MNGRGWIVASSIACVVACSSNSKDGGAPNPPPDTGADVKPPLPEASCNARSFTVSRPAPGVAGVVSILTLTFSTVHEAASATGKSQLLAQWTGGNLELDYLGQVADGNDVNAIGGTLVLPADDPAPQGSFCILPGTVWHKTSTGGKIDLVVSAGDCPDAGDAGPVVDAGDAGASTIDMKACIVFGG